MKIKYTKFTPTNIFNYHKWFNDDRVTFGLSPHTPHDFPSILKWSIFVWLNKNKRYLIINCNDQTIGHVGLTLSSEQPKVAEVSLVIGETEYWNKGIGRIAILEMIHIAKKNKITKIIARIFDENTVSIRLFSSLNFVPNGEKTTWKDKTFSHYVNKIKIADLAKSCNTNI